LPGLEKLWFTSISNFLQFYFLVLDAYVLSMKLFIETQTFMSLVHYLIGIFLQYHDNETCYAVRYSAVLLDFWTFFLINAVMCIEMLLGPNFVELHLSVQVRSFQH